MRARAPVGQGSTQTCLSTKSLQLLLGDRHGAQNMAMIKVTKLQKMFLLTEQFVNLFFQLKALD